MTNLPKRVVIVGGGYAGITAARALDPHLDVTLIERKETFFHNVGSLRAAVDGAWTKKLFIPYSQLLQRGRVLHGVVAEVTPQNMRLTTGEALEFDYLILATGSTYPFPAKLPVDNVQRSTQLFQQTNARIQQARSILLIGAGPVGIEFAGEIAHRYPDKRITLIDGAPTLLRRFKPKLGERLLADLQRLSVRVILGEQLQNPPRETNVLLPDAECAPQTFVTDKGTSIEADLYFLCYGATVDTGYLAPSFADVRDAYGRIKVNQYLQVQGHERIFAIGDVTDVDEPKLAAVAGFHADIVAENIRRLESSANSATALKAYQPMKANLMIVPVGPRHGAGQLPILGGFVVGSWLVGKIKGKSLLVERYWKALGAPTPTHEIETGAIERSSAHQ